MRSSHHATRRRHHFAAARTAAAARLPDSGCRMAEPLEERRLLSVSLVSVNSGGTAPGGAASGAGAGGAFLQPAISADGRYVAFTSDASDLVANGNDNNSARDVFVRDTQANTTALVSIAADNSGSGNGASGDVGTAGVSPTGGVGISADGRYVVFVSAASNLVANDNNNAPDVFVRDTQSGTTALVTVDAAGGSATVPGGSAGSYDPVISDDGRYVAFVSTASNLSGADSGDGGAPDVFLRDLQVQPGAANAITLLTAAVSGGTGTAAAPTISNDGRYVAFLSDDQLVSGTAANGNDQVFVYDNSGGAQNGTITLASPDAAGTGAAGAAVMSPRISGDGRSVAFASDATNLVPNFTDANGTGKADVYVRDLDANTTTLVSDASAVESGTGGMAANIGGNGASYAPAISDDGNVVAFASDATDLVANVTDNNNGRDVFVRDLAAGTTSLASVSTTAGTAGDQPSGTAGGTGNGNTLPPALSGDGRFV
ncbi:MAG TPA: hypothetical protein VL371_13130, partial [Gemmataceae bacterium]|nr:hypothetical protein [Gemmataceae bacterium]